MANDIAANSGDTALVSVRVTENAGARLNFTGGTAGFVKLKECRSLAACLVSRAPQTGRGPTVYVQGAGKIHLPDNFRPDDANTVRSCLSANLYNCMHDVDPIYSGAFPSRESAWREVD